MHVAEIKKTYKGKQHATTLVRRSFREGRKVKHETIVNISGLPQDVIESLKVRFRTTTMIVFELTCFCACWRTTWNGTCVMLSRLH